MNRWLQGLERSSSDGLVNANRKGLAAVSLAPDEPTVHQLKHQVICVNGQMRGKATASNTG
jgi:hypothetical protein